MSLDQNPSEPRPCVHAQPRTDSPAAQAADSDTSWRCASCLSSGLAAALLLHGAAGTLLLPLVLLRWQHPGWIGGLMSHAGTPAAAAAGDACLLGSQVAAA